MSTQTNATQSQHIVLANDMKCIIATWRLALVLAHLSRFNICLGQNER